MANEIVDQYKKTKKLRLRPDKGLCKMHTPNKVSFASTESYRENYGSIFGKKRKKKS